MPDLNEVLQQVERNTPPDLWPIVRDREWSPLAPPIGSPHRRWATILVAACISFLALGFAWRAFGSQADEPAQVASATLSAAAPPLSLTEPIEIRTAPESEVFAPPSVGSVPALSSSDAVDTFSQEHPGIILPADIDVSLGEYTATNADGSDRFRDRLAYGINFHLCVADQPSCDFWIFVDADTGHLLESTWAQ